MSRPRAIAVVLALMALLGLFAWWRPPVAPAPATCPDGRPMRLSAAGVATCGDGARMPAGKGLTLRQKFDCNLASEADFALVPGVGPHVARELIQARDGGFASWEQIDAVAGVGGVRLQALQAACEIRLGDAGVW